LKIDTICAVHNIVSNKIWVAILLSMLFSFSLLQLRKCLSKLYSFRHWATSWDYNSSTGEQMSYTYKTESAWLPVSCSLCTATVLSGSGPNLARSILTLRMVMGRLASAVRARRLALRTPSIYTALQMGGELRRGIRNYSGRQATDRAP